MLYTWRRVSHRPVGVAIPHRLLMGGVAFVWEREHISNVWHAVRIKINTAPTDLFFIGLDVILRRTRCNIAPTVGRDVTPNYVLYIPRRSRRNIAPTRCNITPTVGRDITLNSVLYHVEVDVILHRLFDMILHRILCYTTSNSTQSCTD